MHCDVVCMSKSIFRFQRKHYFYMTSPQLLRNVFSPPAYLWNDSCGLYLKSGLYIPFASSDDVEFCKAFPDNSPFAYVKVKG